MRPAAYGLGWHIVQRHRLGLSLLTAGMLGLVTLRQIPGVAIGAVIGCSIWSLFGLLYVAAIFTQPEADITAPGSGYPNHLFILPVRTRELVLWPMLYGGLCLAAGWLVIAGLVMNRPPAVAPLVWPACMMVAALTSLQALFWTPMRFPTARVFISLGLLGGLIYFGAGNPLGLAEWKLSAVYGGVALASYAVAVRGVACARMSAQSIGIPKEAASRRRVSVRAPFPSAQKAQFWYEWRRGGFILPIVTFALCALFSIPLFSEHTFTTYPDFPVSMNVYVAVYSGALLRGVPFTAWILGGAVWISGARASALAIPAFIAMRPLSSFQMALARFKSRLKSASIAFGLMLVVVLLWLMFPGGLMDARTGLVEPRGPALPQILLCTNLGDLGVAFVYVALLFAITARNYVVGQFASLSGKPAMAYAYMATVYAGPVLAMSILVLGQGQGGLTQTNMYEFFIGGVAMKSIASFIVVKSILRRNQASAKAVAGFVGVWCLTVFAVYEAFNLVMRAHGPIPRLLGFTDLQSGFPHELLWLMAILWTPLARLAAMPLMIENNRRGTM